MEPLLKTLASPGKAVLCIGPLSTNIIKSSAELSESFAIPLVFVASRRQIDAASLGGGYVNGWSTEEYVQYMRELPQQNIFLARDHGGPAQGLNEANTDRATCIERAKASFAADIAHGMDLIHIDTSSLYKNPQDPDGLKCMLELYGFVQEEAQRLGRKVAVEIGTEEHSGQSPDLEFLRHLLETMQSFCRDNDYDFPLFLVSQTGARVEGRQNVGLLEKSENKTSLLESISKASEVAGEFNCFIKAHNADYLSTENLILHPKLGIKAINVAPELGVAESTALVEMMEFLGCKQELEEFFQIVWESGFWRKWLVEGAPVDAREAALIAGHYCFNHPQVRELMARIADKGSRRWIDLDVYLQTQIRGSLLRYAYALGHA